MTDVHPALADELELLAPFDHAAGDWRDVRHRSGGRPRRGLPRSAAAALLGVLALGTAANAAFGWKVSPFWAWVRSYPPGRTSPIVTVFSGPAWNLVAWNSTRGICLSYGAPGAGGSGCEGLSPPVLAVAGGSWNVRTSTVSGTVYGTVAASVVRLSIVGSGAPVAAPLRADPALRTRRRFFFATLPPGSRELLAVDRRGHVLARWRAQAGQRRPR